MGSKSDKRRAIIVAAEKVFQNRRFDEVTLDEVTSEAGVGKGTLYLYFKDKEDLFLQMASDGFEELRDRLASIAATDAKTRDKLCRIGIEMGSTFKKRHAVFRALISQIGNDKHPGAKEIMTNHRARMSKIILSVLQQGVDEGTIREDADLNIVECAFATAFHGREFRKLHGAPDAPVPALVDLILQGAGAR